jgi:site-specific DNA-methyltransferase (cytosine-N4-specific)
MKRIAPFYRDAWLTAYEGDARSVMAGFPDGSIHSIMTSPPYWGLRDYGLPDAIWGGDPTHDHVWTEEHRCSCAAWLGQLGLEPTIEEYVAHLLEVLRAARRVLRDDGTLWLNLGDSFATRWASRRDEGRAGLSEEERSRRTTPPPGFKNKDLVGMPWRVALALQADGWFLRKDIIWAKANPQPESVVDRPAKSFEYVFLLTKSARYYYDVDAMRQVTGSGAHNLRDVWTIASDPYPASHFAVFPDELAIPPIRSGTSARGVCAKCGAPFVRDTERTTMILRRSTRTHDRGQTRASGTMLRAPSSKTVGWIRTCKHDDGGMNPAIVMDPFAGTGTVGIVARRYLRRAIMIDLDGTYVRDRLVTRAEYDTAKAVSETEWFEERKEKL